MSCILLIGWWFFMFQTSTTWIMTGVSKLPSKCGYFLFYYIFFFYLCSSNVSTVTSPNSFLLSFFWGFIKKTWNVTYKHNLVFSPSVWKHTVAQTLTHYFPIISLHFYTVSHALQVGLSNTRGERCALDVREGCSCGCQCVFVCVCQ